jgi:hypothetical protein
MHRLRPNSKDVLKHKENTCGAERGEAHLIGQRQRCGEMKGTDTASNLNIISIQINISIKLQIQTYSNNQIPNPINIF